MNQLDFKGRHAVVTGGATGLGYAIAQRWLRRAAACRCGTATKPGAPGRPGAGPGTQAVAVDVAQQPSVAAAVQATLAKTGRIDALVNSAGITGPNTKVWDYPVDAWRQVMEVNLTGLFICCREVVPAMRERNYGRIVNIASVAGKDGNPNASAYSASKAGVMALTKSLGKELADTGVRVNCVTPAAVKTAIFDQMTPEHICLHAVQNPHGPLRHDRRGGGHGGLAVHRGLFLFHRRRIRPLGRQIHLLNRRKK
jgi:NAD(P)-dependent dehydrogenase (short-subunit alcohol dehydrogenase family)